MTTPPNDDSVPTPPPHPPLTTETLALEAKDQMERLGVDAVVTIALTPDGLVVGACAMPDGPTLVTQAMLRACQKVFDAVDAQLKKPTRPCPSCGGRKRVGGVVCIPCGGRGSVEVEVQRG